MDLMDEELSASFNRQDVSAKAKFDAFLVRLKRKHTFDTLCKTDVTKKLVGQLCTFLLEGEAVSWQTSMNYLSSIRRQAEEVHDVQLFKDKSDWYKKCRRNLHQKYVLKAIATGKPLKEQALTMTFTDLIHLCKGLFHRNTKQSLMDRTLLNNQWLAIGRSSDIGNLSYDDLHWQDHYLLIDLARLKTRQQHSISIFCAPCEWSIDPFHSLACQLIADPYNASRQVFSQIGDGKTEARIAAHINRVLRSAYELDSGLHLTRGLQSHSTRRGGAAHASSHSEIKLPDLAHRGLWSMDGYATILEYISTNSSSDHQCIAKVLGGWRDPSKAGVPPSLVCFQNKTSDIQQKVDAFARYMHHQCFARIHQRGFADSLTATLLMYLDDMLSESPSHIVHDAITVAAGAVCAATVSDLQLWGRAVRKQFVLDNLSSLPVGVIKQNLGDRDVAEQQVGVQTFADSLERCVVGFRELISEVQDIKGSIRHLLDGQASLRMLFVQSQLQHRPQPSVENLNSICSANPILALAQQWPADFTSVSGMKLQDLVVRYVRNNLANVAFTHTNRLHKEVRHAIVVVKRFGDLSSVPAHVPAMKASQ